MSMRSPQLVPFPDLVELVRPNKKVKKAEYSDKGSLPVVDQGEGLVGGFTSDLSYRVPADPPLIVFGDHTCRFKFVGFPFAAGADGTQLFKGREGISTQYLYYACLTLGLQHFGYQRHFKHLKASEVPVYDLPTQRRIASILSAYDDLIENNTRRIAILEEMARRLYEEWFVKFRFPGHEDVALQDTPVGRVPSGWPIQTVADTFGIVGGGTPSKKERGYWEGGTVNWYTPTDLTRAGTSFIDASAEKITELGLRKSSAQLFPAFSVMMTSRATIGAIAINTTEACTNQGFITCLPNERFPLYLLLHWLRANVDLFVSLGTGATFKEITKGTFKKIPLAVPPTALAQRFDELVSPMMKQVLTLQRKNANLCAQRDLLLPKLVSGEIDVSDIPLPDEETAVA